MTGTSAEPLVYGYLASPVGQLLLVADADHLRGISFPDGSRKQEPLAGWRRDDAYFPDTVAQLRAYFAGELREFSLPLLFDGTPFQNAVWQALCDIPYGETTSYGALAATVGNVKASRAVGAANGANPLPIVVPCHRVIGADSSLTGFGGGVDVKHFLLTHEKARGYQGQLF
ncbi:MAG: methylated-DNA--[protein]-cysteine S-methyltransferase [Pseudomonadota bacterium]